MSPYRTTALSQHDIQPTYACGPCFFCRWRHRINRLYRRLLIKLKGTWLKRHPWPCPKCDNRTNLEFTIRLTGNPHYPEECFLVHHLCCNVYHHTEKPSAYYWPRARYSGIIRLKSEPYDHGQDWGPSE